MKVDWNDIETLAKNDTFPTMERNKAMMTLYRAVKNIAIVLINLRDKKEKE